MFAGRPLTSTDFVPTGAVPASGTRGSELLGNSPTVVSPVETLMRGCVSGSRDRTNSLRFCQKRMNEIERFLRYEVTYAFADGRHGEIC